MTFIILLAVLVLLVGTISYMLLKRLIEPVRIFGSCLIMVFVGGSILHLRETIARGGIFVGLSLFPTDSDQSARNAPNPIRDPGSEANDTFQSISKEDHIFLDEIMRNQGQDNQMPGKALPSQVENTDKTGLLGPGNERVLRAELVINTAEVRRAEPVLHKETVKRAEPVRSRQQ